MEIKTNIGELDTLVSIQSCVITRGDRGQKSYNFVPHSKVWAKVDRISDEAIGNHNLEDGQSLQVTMYKISGLTTRWRIVINDKPYSITGIDPISRFSPLCSVTLSAID